MTTTNYERITKRQWAALGGLTCSRLFRRMRRGSWQYFIWYYPTAEQAAIESIREPRS